MSNHFILLLLFCVHLTTSAAVVAKGSESDNEKKENTEMFNKFRVGYAKRNNVGNMHELIYDSGLEKIAKEMSKDCKFEHGNYVLISDEQTFEKINEIYHPLQTQFACIELNTPCPERKIEKGFCLFGPNSNVAEKSISLINQFEPTTTLHPSIHSMMNKRFILLLVFCVHLASSAEILAKRATVEEQKKIIESLNDLRVTYAKQNNVGNMHELSYDSGLEKIAKDMSKGCSFGHGNYVLISEEQMFEKMHEIYHPLQTQAACVDLLTPCPERKIEKGFCLLGPQSDTFSEKLFKTGPLGSHCTGKPADNGLCKAGSGASGGSDEAKDGGSETKTAAQMNSIVLAVAFAIAMIFP